MGREQRAWEGVAEGEERGTGGGQTRGEVGALLTFAQLCPSATVEWPNRMGLILLHPGKAHISSSAGIAGGGGAEAEADAEGDGGGGGTRVAVEGESTSAPSTRAIAFPPRLRPSGGNGDCTPVENSRKATKKSARNLVTEEDILSVLTTVPAGRNEGKKSVGPRLNFHVRSSETSA